MVIARFRAAKGSIVRNQKSMMMTIPQTQCAFNGTQTGCQDLMEMIPINIQIKEKDVDVKRMNLGLGGTHNPGVKEKEQLLAVQVRVREIQIQDIPAIGLIGQTNQDNRGVTGPRVTAHLNHLMMEAMPVSQNPRNLKLILPAPPKRKKEVGPPKEQDPIRISEPGIGSTSSKDF